MLQNLENIKIPYPTEGVIRTAAIDDTVAPTDSVQIAVNLNFDKVGGFKTRKGISEYADQLSGLIKNFGTLKHQSNDPGYDSINPVNDSQTFSADTTKSISVAQYDSTHYIVFWKGVDDDGFVQVVSVDLTTGIIDPIGSPLEFDTTLNDYNSCVKVDATHFLNFWKGSGNHGFAQVFLVNSSTFAVTAVGSALDFDATLGAFNSCGKIDSNHFINFWCNGGTGKTQVFNVNLSTYAVTALGSPLTFESTQGFYNSCKQVDASHFINFWFGNSSTGRTQVFLINLSTFAVTAVGSAFTFDANEGSYNSCQMIDSSHFINFWLSVSGTTNIGLTRTFNVNLSTFAVTFAGAALQFQNVGGQDNSSVSVGDGEHFVNFWRDVGNNLNYTQIFKVNLTSFNVDAVNLKLSLGNISGNSYNSVILVNSTQILNFWRMDDGTGIAQLFNFLGAVIYERFLYAQQQNGDILNWDNPGWVVRRSGLNTDQKARFMQYINRIWMVNGNGIFGNAVMTSDGGDFDTTLVPDGFPPGDFIQGGFEGRVWVADKDQDVIYFTDIVEFTPPNTYTLTFDPTTNFIKNFSPQNGQTMTGLFTTPRALLLFKEDSIYRIYGAFSVDSYPAYNVGTYSQESIVQTKDGLYFHHSSGFYKFAYDSQPIEISRRIIDFIQAIPRSNYPEVKGIYDGFDAILWAIGPVTVEGVTYTNCVCRYTISTQIWTIYDYPDNDITAYIQYDDGENLNLLLGTEVGKVGKFDDGFTDFDSSIYFELIDRWRSYTEMYAMTKSISGMNIYNENAAGTLIQYQGQESGVNVWEDLGTINEDNNALLPNIGTKDFNAGRIRLSGNTSGTPVGFHGIELLSINVKGFDKN